MVPYDSAGNYYNDRPTTHCIVCGKKLQLSNEFDKCTDCAFEIINNEVGDIKSICPKCQSDNTEKTGIMLMSMPPKIQMKCLECGEIFVKENEVKKEI